MRAGRLWPLGLGLLLAAGVGVNVVLLVAAAGDPSFGVEEDYYGRAAAWDRTLAERAASQRLGWTVSPEVVPDPGAPRLARLVLRLADRSGVAVRGATVRVEAFHNARSGRRLEVALPEDPGGGYSARLPMTRPGLWELRVVATRGAERFVASLPYELEAR